MVCLFIYFYSDGFCGDIVLPLTCNVDVCLTYFEFLTLLLTTRGNVL